MLDGLPNLQDLAKIMVGETVPENFWRVICRASRGAQATIKAGIAALRIGARLCFHAICCKGILEDTEEHIDFLETQIDLIDKVGLQNYQQSQMGEVS